MACAGVYNMDGTGLGVVGEDGSPVQVRVCPKCKAENKLSNASCSSCYASLEGALMKEVADAIVPEAQQNAQPQIGAAPPPAPGMPTIGGPRPAEGPPPGAPPSPYGPPPSQVYTPPSRENMRPTKQGPNVLAIVLIIVLLGGAGFGAWWMLMRPKSPDEVVNAFVSAAKAGDVEKLKSYLTTNCRSDFDKPGVIEGLKRSFGGANAKESDESTVKAGKTTFEGDSKALVELLPAKSTNAAPNANTSLLMVLVKEEGQWRIDSKQT
jgi:hypothetical protein